MAGPYIIRFDMPDQIRHPRIKANRPQVKGCCFVCDEIMPLVAFDLSIQKQVCHKCLPALIGADIYLGSTPGISHPVGTVIP